MAIPLRFGKKGKNQFYPKMGPQSVSLPVGFAALGVPLLIAIAPENGVPPPLASWGNMLYDGKLLLHQAWWMWVLLPLSILSGTASATHLIHNREDAERLWER